MKNNVADLIRVFDEAHVVKQIILIGEDGVTRNIELAFVEDDK